MITPPKGLEPNFRAAGWTGKPRPFPRTFSEQHIAWEILESFNDIHLFPDTGSPGSDIHFELISFCCPIASQWQKWLATRFIGVASTHNQYCALWVATNGSVFSSNDITDVFVYVGSDIMEATRNILSGTRNQPLLPHNEIALNCYGEDYCKGDPRLFDWQKFRSEK